MNSSTEFPTTPCIEWTGSKTQNGYGRIKRSRLAKSPILIHRYTWEQANGPIPKGMVVMHLCDNRGCYRLDHLMVGTQGDNLRMAYARGMPLRGIAVR